MRFLILVVLLGLPLPAAAQVPLMTPGPAHERLSFLVGDWDVATTMHFRGEEHASANAVSYRWMPGGVWLEADTDIPNSPIGPMWGSARIAWDEPAEQYVYHWIDNQSTVVLTQRGGFVNDSTLVFTGSFEWIDGTVFHQRLVFQRRSDGTWSEEGYMGTDPKNLSMNHEGIATRRN